MSDALAGFLPLYQRRLALALKTPIGLISQALTPVLWVLIVGPAMAASGIGPREGFFSYIAIGQIAFILPFSAMFAGLTVLTDRNFGILRELLAAPIRRVLIPLASIAAVVTIGLGQVALIVVLSLLRGAEFHLSLGATLAGVAAGALLTVGAYAVAEYLAYSLRQPQIFGTLIPAIGATPYLLCGALYPIAKLPEGVRQAVLILPHTHAIALLRGGFLGSRQSDLGAIWHLHSHLAMSLLSLGVLVVWAIGTTLVAIRAFRRATVS
jgi:ABC-2 type transport system permease protein